MSGRLDPPLRPLIDKEEGVLGPLPPPAGRGRPVQRDLGLQPVGPWKGLLCNGGFGVVCPVVMRLESEGQYPAPPPPRPS